MAALAAGVAIVLTGASTAQASEATKIIERCAHGESIQGFKPSAYREALKQLPTEIIEYLDPCVNQIRKAALASAGGSSGGPTGGSSNTPIPLTPAESKAVQSAHKGAPAVPIGNAPIRPGVVHADIASAINKLPHSLFAMLAFLIACALVLIGGEARKRVSARRNG